MLRLILDKFWDEHFWLPPNTTWADVAPGADRAVVYNDHIDLLWPIPLAMMLIVLRHVVEKYCFSPFGKTLGVKYTTQKKAPSNPLLEAAYQTASKIKHERIYALSKQLDMSERQVERWWRLRRSQDKPSTLVKFCESCWRCTFYLYNFSYGLFILWDKEWLWDIDQCYVGYPHQGLTNDVWWYYMISSAFYWSLTISQFWDVRRKDFWMIFVHHMATIGLFSFSWVCNFHRIGTLILLSHECTEILLEAAKAAKYASYQKLCDFLFAVFTLLWIITRNGVYPFHIVWNSSFRAPMFMPTFPAFYITNALLWVLLALHVVWTWIILQVVYKTIIAGKMEGDIRSSSSEISDSSHHSTPNRKET